VKWALGKMTGRERAWRMKSAKPRVSSTMSCFRRNLTTLINGESSPKWIRTAYDIRIHRDQQGALEGGTQQYYCKSARNARISLRTSDSFDK
jgi:hypothetical protein